MAVFKIEKNNKVIWCVKVRYDTWTGERKQKKKEGFKTRREALEWENNFLNSCKNDVDITFENLVHKYMEDCKARLAKTTISNKTYLIETKLVPYFGKMPINKITVSTVRTWQNTMITHKNNYSPTYLKTLHNQLSAIMNFAVKYYGLPKNPAAQCGSMGKKYADTMLFWTLDEFNQFMTVVDDPTMKVIFNLLFYSGIREGEMLALTLNDFNFENNTLSINKSYAVVDKKEIIKEPKTPKSKRIVAISLPIMNLVKEYSQTIYGYKPNERLFPTTKSSLYRAMKKYSELAGVKKIRIHDLRHSHASLLIEKGVPPLAISERLGHEDIQTTLNTYSHLYPNKQNEIADMLSSLIV